MGGRNGKARGELASRLLADQDTNHPTLSRLQALGAVENPHSNPQDDINSSKNGILPKQRTETGTSEPSHPSLFLTSSF